MEMCLVGLILILAFIFAWIHQKIKGPEHRSYHHAHDPNGMLPNGYCRSDYHQQGLTDSDIDVWGMDRPDAPPPSLSGYAILDMQDGKLDGKIDFDHHPWDK